MNEAEEWQNPNIIMIITYNLPLRNKIMEGYGKVTCVLEGGSDCYGVGVGLRMA